MKDEYLVKDLYEAAFLYSIKKPFKGLLKESNYFWFIFENKKDCEQASQGYWSGTAFGVIKNYADAIKTLKERLFAQK